LQAERGTPNKDMNTKNGRILVVDDNSGIRRTMEILLPMYFAEVQTIASPNSLVSELETFRPDVVLLDMNFTASINSGGEGLYWLGEIKRLSPQTQVVLFTAYADIQLAVEGMKRGAFDFIVKPWENEKLISTLRAAAGKKSPSKSLCSGGIPKSKETPMFWGSTTVMTRIRGTVRKVAPTDATVLITGENGTGKDLLAQEIHNQSLRSGKQMVAVDAGAVTETLFESELFGHVKGAFTDAHADHPGKFEQANGGTLFLDEIGNIPLHLQAKLLRVLQNREVVRVGGMKIIPVDIRLICATNMDLEALVREGKFREDLYYRINTVHLNLPALRDRREDILPLVERFINEFADKYHRSCTPLSPEMQDQLVSRHWSGNIRELRNCIERAVIMYDGTWNIETDNSSWKGLTHRGGADEETQVREAISRFHGNVSAAAKALGISRPTLYAKLKKYGL